MEIEQRLQREDETMGAWIKRLDKEMRQIQAIKKDPPVDPEIYERPVKLPKGQKVGVDINQVLTSTLKEGGVATRVFGELVNTRQPVVAGRRLITLVSQEKDRARLNGVVEALLSKLGPVSRVIVSEVCPRNKKWRRKYPGATESFAELTFAELTGGMKGTVIDRVVAQLEPTVKKELVEHPLGEMIYTLQAPTRKRIREMVRKENDPFFTG